MGEVDELQLWKLLEQKGTDSQRQMVRSLVDYAAPILDRIIETFPTYTLHNAQHARNVAELMAKLLGDRLEDLTPLEAAFLILSAYWHDIGMAFQEDERARLTEEPQWENFLQNHAEAYLAVKGDPKAEPPLAIAEWYCRWRHADRVSIYLNAAAAQGQNLKWGVVDLREALGNLCRSHNEGIDRIQVNAVLKTDYLAGQADLRFCAILLRLADILDFDRTRSPDSVYQYLDLKRRADSREKVSDTEWRKHLAADGFVFPADRSPRYVLDFIAGPDHPEVEHDLRQFLDVIEGEIEQCAALLPTCSKGWHEFALPGRIRRDSIVANGYRYGEYRSSLDQHQILDLLMGENLYENPYVFVREMLQNALDASRLREHLERLRGNKNFEAEPIRVSEWLDRDRYRWVRFDDYGTGMDEQIVRDHLLKVGSSYYNSAQYKADMLRASKGTGSDFMPISRFGIGILSCFIAGDRVEISTLRQLPGGTRATPVRLSLDGLHGFYTLQTLDVPATPLPAPDTASNEEPGYRTGSNFGTSIAIRLDPRKERQPLHLKTTLEKYLLCPPVPVVFQGERIGGDNQKILETPWCTPATIRLSESEKNGLGISADGNIDLHLTPIDLTKHSPSQTIQGQAVLVDLRRTVPNVVQRSVPRYGDSFTSTTEIIRWELVLDPTLEIKVTRRTTWERVKNSFVDLHFRDLDFTSLDYQQKEDVRSITVDRLQQYVSASAWTLLSRGARFCLSHNGIFVPHDTNLGYSISIDSNLLDAPASVAFGLLYLSDRLRPDMSAARELLYALPWEVYSMANLALRRAAPDLWSSESTRAQSNLIVPLMPVGGASLGRILNDPSIDLNGPWAKERIFNTDEGQQSLEQLVATTDESHRPTLILPIPPKSALDMYAAALAQRFLEIQLARVERSWGGQVTVSFHISDKRKDVIPEEDRLFRPLVAASFGHDKLLRGRIALMNRDHPFADWLFRNAGRLSAHYPGILQRIRANLLDPDGDEWKPESCLTAVNGALERLAELDPEACPPRSAYLKPSDLSDEWHVQP